MAHAYSPVSPVEMQPPPTVNLNTTRTQTFHASNASRSGTFQKGGWLPFTLRWYYLVVPTVLSLRFGSVLVYLSIHSKQNHGLGDDNGSSAILFGWRFTPTLIAVLYAQMTVILFEDVKRTEPFTRLAKAPAGGTSAYGTLLQTPRAWWSIFIDVCFRRKKLGHTSWSLICAALINVIALMLISPLSSALLTSEEISVPKTVDFSRIISKADTQVPMLPTRETYYRTINALLRNVSTSAWVTDTSLTFPFWPTSESAQFGPNLESSFGTWNTETITLKSTYECEEMKLESADMAPQNFSGVYTTQRYGPFNGTQPMVTFKLASKDGCKYQLTIHPAVDLASAGGVTWSNASTFFPISSSILPLGGRPYVSGVSPTHLFARYQTSDQCKGRDIITLSSAWTAPLNRTWQSPSFIPLNQTYERSAEFRMRGILCESKYFMNNQSMEAAISGNKQQMLNSNSDLHENWQPLPESLINIKNFEAASMKNDWESYFDAKGMYLTETKPASGIYPGFSGMAPLLATSFNYNLTAMLENPNIAQRAASMKGRFFMETMREAFDNRDILEQDVTSGEATIIANRVVVLQEIGFTLAALFFASAVLLVVVFFSSRLRYRPLNLQSDPASTIGLSLMLQRRLGALGPVERMHNASRVDLYTGLQKEKYFTSDNILLKGDGNTDPPQKVKPKRNWRPRVIHVRTLLALGLVLTLVMVAILILNAFSARSQLSQVAFIYEANVSKLGLSFSTFAPISIAPTVVSIVVGLWWDQLDSTWRILQPFISMSRGPVPIRDGAGLTYRSKTWAGAAFKSGRQKHWVLLLIAIGSVLAQVLTVSMSALFERQTHNIAHPVSFPRSLEIRQVPVINEIKDGYNSVGSPADKVLDSLYLDASKNWLYGAGIQQTFNGSRLPWSSDGWSFLPVDLPTVFDNTSNQAIASSGTDGTDHTASFSTNVTMKTPAIRARLDCTVVEEITNTSSWITLYNLTNRSASFNPQYFSQINSSGEVELYSLEDYMFTGSDSRTFTMSSPTSVGCCQNGTILDPQQSLLGYWSPVLPPYRNRTVDEGFPYNGLTWPLKFTSKWIVGKAITMLDRGNTSYVYYKEIPRMQAAQCAPIIETAEASITFDSATGDVHSHTIDTVPLANDGAWSDVFTLHDAPKVESNDESFWPEYPQNVTTSFGILFVGALLGLADREHANGYSYEDLKQNAFVFRDPNNGINMDLMTYSMYTLAKKDPEALLNYTVLATHADRTFQTFFQHFVNSGLSPSRGGYAYQPINDDSMTTLTHSVDGNGTAIAEKSFPVLNTNRTVEASISQRIRVLHMNSIATYLSVAILIWLIFTTLIVVCLQRQYTRFMNRDVHLIADMLVLVAGSDNLLDLVQDKGVGLKKNKDVKTMLGWFRDRNGEVRWGVEVVGGRNAVEWVDAPKTGFHVPVKSPPSKLWGWRPWKKN
ncbi:hypothetical protein HBH64_109950 [Parastagonospora nodorum]|nr:hypothetical protein HBH43_081390 [Parastagonospora nodorum]KAH4302380.1 hypothetical protein HBI02_140650 [Parastagonospora nodorum]KAH4305584.1 hypothetical protein HBI01_067880 [Parastagonospora nodorum]KAH4329142.1 hypothetical protein HBI00_098810 [Parastagonospora nodorum]KAH4374528.1 hypothetical protein HBH94_103730 [Parastagonospora nodorum]